MAARDDPAKFTPTYCCSESSESSHVCVREKSKKKKKKKTERKEGRRENLREKEITIKSIDRGWC